MKKRKELTWNIVVTKRMLIALVNIQIYFCIGLFYHNKKLKAFLIRYPESLSTIIIPKITVACNQNIQLHRK